MVRRATTVDVMSIKKLLVGSPAIATDSLLRDIVDHVTNEYSMVMEKNNQIVGVWLSKEYEDYISLSFMYIEESERKKPSMLEFIKICLEGLPLKRVFIKTNDTTGFARYVKHIKDDVYEFKGFRWEQ